MNDTPVYRANVGPPKGLVLAGAYPCALGVLDERAVNVLGMAFGAGPITIEGELVASFSLTVRKQDLPGLYVISDRRFVLAVTREPGEDG